LATVVENRSHSRISGEISDDVQDPSYQCLVLVIHECMQQSHRDTVDLFALQRRDQGANLVLIEGFQNAACVVQPLSHRESQVARHKRVR
jgi:hypothetical protein